MTKTRQLGYNLVEIALVLTIVLMISSLLAVKYYQVQQEARSAETARVISIINEAIMDYAANNVTQKHVFLNTAATLSVRAIIPPGRPYLPCPDVTGDGLEDRRVIPDVAIFTVNVALGLYPAEQSGDCYSNKGVVPWKTLKTPPTDLWGNRYTYRVDDDFSNALFGFDEISRSDQSFLSRPLSVSFVSGVPVAIRDVAPIALSIVRGVVGNWSSGIDNIVDPSVICENAPCPSSGTTQIFVVGDVLEANSDIVVSDLDWDGEVRYVLEAGQVATGVPVVVLSHGKNGYGAVRGGIDSSFICNPVPDTNVDEAQNAYWSTAVNDPTSNYICADNSAIVVGGRQNGFVSHPRSEGSGVQEFDDIVGWISTSDLGAGLRRRKALPVQQLLPPIGLEDY